MSSREQVENPELRFDFQPSQGAGSQTKFNLKTIQNTKKLLVLNFMNYVTRIQHHNKEQRAKLISALDGNLKELVRRGQAATKVCSLHGRLMKQGGGGREEQHSPQN